MYGLLRSALIGAIAFGSTVLAQTSTACQPLNGTCPPDVALGSYSHWDLTSSKINPAVWKSISTPLDSNRNGSVFTIRRSGDSPTIESQFYIFFGSVSVVMRASEGDGICSSIVLLSDDLDEIDWEFLGSNTTGVQSNYFGKGNTQMEGRGGFHKLPYVPQSEFHNYTINWTKEKTEWIIDGKVIRTLPFAAAAGGQYYPQTPMKIVLGSWAAGDPAKNAPGVVAWAEATTDFAKGPWSMNIKDVYIQDATSGAKYTYGDTSGSWQSIKVTDGVSPIVAEINRPFGPGAHWRALAHGTRIAIIAGSLAGFALLVGAIVFCCIRSTRKGLREHAKAEADWEQQQREAVIWQKRYNAERASTIGSSKRSLV